jgi:hypothetical protein
MMNSFFTKTHKVRSLAALALAFSCLSLQAGNEDRAGSAGSTDLLINPWARSSGWANSSTAIGRGLESEFMNVAGLAFTDRTELLFTHTRWLAGSDIGISAFGFAQNLGKNRGVLGITVASLGSGDIQETTTEQPEGTGSVYSVNNLNLGISYAKSFSKSIHGGVTIRLINQAIANVSAAGFAIDAGIMYKTSIGNKKKTAPGFGEDNLHFGINLKNIGPRMIAIGDGLTVKNESPIFGAPVSQQQRSAEFEMPALMNIGLAYVQYMAKKHKLTTAFNFTTNSFTKDQFLLGLEYDFNSMLQLRGGYSFESGIFGERDGVQADLLNAFTGPSAGFSFESPLKKEGRTKIGVDYSFRATYNFSGVHTFGVHILL